MTLEISLDLAPDGDAGLTLTFHGAGGPEVLARPWFAFDRDQLERLRLGQAAKAEAAPVAAAISDWLLGTDLRDRFATFLGGQDAIRVVVRADRELLTRLSDVPFELVRMPNATVPLVLERQVASLVRVTPAFAAMAPSPAPGWPFRVLIVRTNPNDLGGNVPAVGPVKAKIDEIVEGMDISSDSVRVDVLTSEENGDPPVTWKAFRDQLKAGPYHVLVYLGHGQVTKVDDLTSVGYLQFEEVNGHTPIDGGSIAGQLIQQPVQVVILAACLTAAGGGLEEQLPDSLRGVQGVAEAIIGSGAAVDVAVGMRDLLEVQAATQLLVAFFTSLLKENPGDVERSIRAARNELFADNPYPPSWSSAVVYTKGSASKLSFLAEKPTGSVEDQEKRITLEKTRDSRRKLAKEFLGPLADRTSHLQALAVVGDIEKQVIGKDPMIRPRFTEAAAGPVEISVELLGSLKVRRITGAVSITGGGSIQGLAPAPRLAGKFVLLLGAIGTTVQFSIDPVAANGARLTAGPLFMINATVPGPAPAINEVTVTAKTDPDRVVWAGLDLVAVTG